MKAFRNKLPMGALVLCSFLDVADAVRVIVFEAPLDDWHQEVSANFGANGELGRGA